MYIHTPKLEIFQNVKYYLNKIRRIIKPAFSPGIICYNISTTEGQARQCPRKGGGRQDRGTMSSPRLFDVPIFYKPLPLPSYNVYAPQLPRPLKAGGLVVKSQFYLYVPPLQWYVMVSMTLLLPSFHHPFDGGSDHTYCKLRFVVRSLLGLAVNHLNVLRLGLARQ